MTGSVLQLSITVPRNQFTVSVELEVPAGRTLALLGPNGAGKSTVLSVVAGLLSPRPGLVRLGDRVLTDSAKGVAVPPQDRRVALMGQDPLLFPHLSALENVAFGPRARGAGRARSRVAAQEWLARMGIGELAGRRPRAMSGGQQQRVALARALAADPQLVLLDEPLGALDARTAPEIRQMLRRHLTESGTTAMLVTHDPLDAAVLADQIVVIDAGQVVDSGPTQTVLNTPRSAFGATLAGLNLLPGTATASSAEGETATVRVADDLVLTGIAHTALSAGDEAAAVFAPAAAAVFAGPVDGSPRNQWPATVGSVEAVGPTVRVHFPGPVDVAADLTPAATAELGLVPGSAVQLVVKATEIRIYRR